MIARHPLAIIAVVGIVFLLALYCWLTGSDNPLDEIPDGDWPSVPPGLADSSFHSAGAIR